MIMLHPTTALKGMAILILNPVSDASLSCGINGFVMFASQPIVAILTMAI